MNYSQKSHGANLGCAINPLWAEFDLIARRKRKPACSQQVVLDEKGQFLAVANAVVSRTASLWR